MQPTPAMKILIVSAYDDDIYVQGLLNAGVNGYHLKDQPLIDFETGSRTGPGRGTLVIHAHHQ